jgi:hypothetical protein
MQFLASVSTLPGLQRPPLLSSPRPGDRRSIAGVFDHARLLATALVTALAAAATVLVGGAALALDAEDADAAGVRFHRHANG